MYALVDGLSAKGALPQAFEAVMCKQLKGVWPHHEHAKERRPCL